MTNTEFSPPFAPRPSKTTNDRSSSSHAAHAGHSPDPRHPVSVSVEADPAAISKIHEQEFHDQESNGTPGEADIPAMLAPQGQEPVPLAILTDEENIWSLTMMHIIM